MYAKPLGEVFLLHLHICEHKMLGYNLFSFGQISLFDRTLFGPRIFWTGPFLHLKLFSTSIFFSFFQTQFLSDLECLYRIFFFNKNSLKHNFFGLGRCRKPNLFVLAILFGCNFYPTSKIFFAFFFGPTLAFYSKLIRTQKSDVICRFGWARPLIGRNKSVK